ncbi:type II 3-dehydroquinate dehydratase [bacterium]|nr:type II 3-dehydroquinate dehydratase [bacterium]MCB2201991.1 type II 3-dehydroquinate dehydratase [bacterium]
MPRILVVNGPNLNLVGTREPEMYGSTPISELNEWLTRLAADLKLELVVFQSNHEGELIDFIQKEAADAIGMIINAGALSHYSYALRDAISAVEIPTAEVHMTNVADREEFRQISVLTPVCVGQISGFGYFGYAMALSFFADMPGEDEE